MLFSASGAGREQVRTNTKYYGAIYERVCGDVEIFWVPMRPVTRAKIVLDNHVSVTLTNQYGAESSTVLVYKYLLHSQILLSSSRNRPPTLTICT